MKLIPKRETEAQRRWRKKHPEKVKALNEKYRTKVAVKYRERYWNDDEFREKEKERQRLYYAEKKRRQRRWRGKNLEEIRAIEEKNRVQAAVKYVGRYWKDDKFREKEKERQRLYYAKKKRKSSSWKQLEDKKEKLN